jgi:hypothetical protein
MLSFRQANTKPLSAADTQWELFMRGFPQPLVLAPSRPALAPEPFVLFHTQRQSYSTVHVIDCRPKVRTIHILAAGRYMHELRLSYPHTVFIAELANYGNRPQFVGAYIFYRNAPLRSFDDTVYETNLPNVVFREGICTGDTADLQRAINAATTDDSIARAILADYFERPFSDHALDHWRRSRTLHPAFQSFADWQTYSQRDPGFILRVPWRPLGTLREQLRDLFRGFNV